MARGSVLDDLLTLAGLGLIAAGGYVAWQKGLFEGLIPEPGPGPGGIPIPPAPGTPPGPGDVIVVSEECSNENLLNAADRWVTGEMSDADFNALMARCGQPGLGSSGAGSDGGVGTGIEPPPAPVTTGGGGASISGRPEEIIKSPVYQRMKAKYAGTYGVLSNVYSQGGAVISKARAVADQFGKPVVIERGLLNAPAAILRSWAGVRGSEIVFTGFSAGEWAQALQAKVAYEQALRAAGIQYQGQLNLQQMTAAGWQCRFTGLTHPPDIPGPWRCAFWTKGTIPDQIERVFIGNVLSGTLPDVTVQSSLEEIFPPFFKSGIEGIIFPAGFLSAPDLQCQVSINDTPCLVWSPTSGFMHIQSEGAWKAHISDVLNWTVAWFNLFGSDAVLRVGAAWVDVNPEAPGVGGREARQKQLADRDFPTFISQLESRIGRRVELFKGVQDPNVTQRPGLNVRFLLKPGRAKIFDLIYDPNG